MEMKKKKNRIFNVHKNINDAHINRRAPKNV